MAKDGITKQDIIMNELSEQYCEYVAELHDEDKREVSDEEVDKFQDNIRHLIKTYGKNVKLVVKINYRKGYIKKDLGKNTYRAARFVTNVLKNGIEIPSDATYFELILCPALLVKNVQKNTVEVDVLDKQPLYKIKVFTGEATKDYEKVSTGKGEYYKLSEDNPNEYVWGEGSFNTRLVKIKGEERTIN